MSPSLPLSCRFLKPVGLHAPKSGRDVSGENGDAGSRDDASKSPFLGLTVTLDLENYDQEIFNDLAAGDAESKNVLLLYRRTADSCDSCVFREPLQTCTEIYCSCFFKYLWQN